MKQILTFVLLFIGGLTTASPVTIENDSLVILFGNKTRMVIHSSDKNGIQELTRYDLNRIIKDMGMKLDSSGSENALVVVDKNNTVRYMRDTVIVVTRKDGNVSVTIRESGKEGVRENQKEKRTNDRVGGDNEDYSVKSTETRRKNGLSRWSMFNVSLGLNALITEDNKGIEGYELRPIGSRFVALSVGQRPILARGRTASLSLYYGVEVAWNNFMFENSNTIRKEQAGVRFPAIGQDVEKSKLTVATVGVPFIPRVTFYNSAGRKVFHFGVGPYVNYRIDSYTKIKYEEDKKDRFRSNYFLNDFRYGIMTQLGIGRTSFFARYDLNPLFQTEKGPDVRAISFGVTL